MVETVGNTRSLPLKGKELRKTNKPLMEKRRRARINTCLNQLKSLVLQAMNKDSSQYSKLEKADILEMTVNFLKAVPQQKARAASQETAAVMSKYSTGFNECASQVARYLDNCQGVDNQVRSRVLSHLSQRVASVNTQQPTPVHPVAAPQHSLQPVYVQIPNTTQPIPGVHNSHGYPINTPVHSSTQSTVNHQGALIVMPSAVVVPTPVSAQQQQQQQTWFHLQQQQQQHYVMPMSPPSSTSSSRGSSPVSMPSCSPVMSQTFSPHAVQSSLVPTHVVSRSEEVWRPW